MTTVSVLTAPHRRAALVDRLAGGVLTRSEAERLYTAMRADVCRAVERSGADLVVAVETADGDADRDAVESELESVLEHPDEMEAVTREPMERETALAEEVLRLQEAGVTSAAVVEPSAPFLARTTVDSASMKLRSSEVVLGPAPDGRVYFAGFGEPLDLSGRFASPAIERLAGLTGEDVGVDFLSMLPVVDGAADLPTAVAHLRARVTAGRAVPEHTATAVADIGLAVSADGGDLVCVRADEA